ncbi:hypothetical protein CPter91_2976 [Collimonas pratensis]|uniref:Uncharacterized protein n=1 Tax=Collimonas pratensis TaxID=279113 RepID=A0A127Q5F5_9BURK|nr:hypothetical protein CPter91_2976 [Collimonas pratensis]
MIGISACCIHILSRASIAISLFVSLRQFSMRAFSSYFHFPWEIFLYGYIYAAI